MSTFSNTFSKKIVSGALTIAITVWMAGALLPAASAQSTADLQAQIAGLLAQIQQLQAKLAAGQGTTVATTYTRNLTVGSKGADVTSLQSYLISKGYLTVAAPTGYYGALTKAAVKAWQAAVGLPSTGYFGPLSRANLNAAVAVVTPPPAGTSTTPAPVAGSGLTVALSSENPPPGSLISGTTGAARTRVLGFSLTAGTGSQVTVTQIQFHKNGVISDSGIAGVYIVQGGRVLYQYNSISSGIITFSGLSLVVPAGQTINLKLAIDVGSGLSAGNTAYFSIDGPQMINSVDASGNVITETGAFPLNGNIFTVTTVSNPALATLTLSSTSIANTVTAGTPNNIAGAWNFSIGNSKAYLDSINFRMIGSANKGDLKNLKLYVNGTQVGSTLASVASDGTAYFDLTASPGTLNTGSNNVQLYADVMGSPSYTFQFEVLNAYDVLLRDSQYNVPILASVNTGTLVTIQQGTINVSQASNTPTGNIAQGQSGVTLAKFTIYAAGEAVKVKFLDFTITFNATGTTAGTLGGEIKNIALTDDAGGQVGTTINTPPSSNACAVATAAYAKPVYNDCFGTSASPVNYIVPANTTRVLSLKADIQSTADFGNVTAALTSESGNNNLQGLTSSQTGSSSGATGSTLTLSTSLLSVAQNSGLGNQNITKNSVGVRIGSYAFTASSASGITVNTVSVTMSTVAGTDFQNVKLLVGGTQFGLTQGVVSNSGIYSFSGTPFTIPAGQTTMVDVYSDILSGATSTSPATSLSGCTGTGTVTYNAITCGSTVAGQGITIAGQSALTVAADSATPAAGLFVMGSSLNSLAAYRFTETSNVENVKITNLNIFDQVASTTTVKPAFGSVANPGLSLWNGSTQVGTAVATTTTAGPGYIYQFSFSTPVVVPQANSLTLVLKGDVSPYSASGATDNTTHVLKIATTTDGINNTTALAVVALGQSSNASSAITLSGASGNAQTVLRTLLTVSGTPLGNTSSRSKTNPDDLATINFAANSFGAVQLNTVTVTFSGSAPSGSNFFVVGTGSPVQLYDPANGNPYFPVASTTNSLTFNFQTINGTTTGNSYYVVSAGTTKSFNLRINSLTPNTAAAASGVAQTLTATISATGNLAYTDGLDTAAVSNINLPASSIPVSLVSITYAQGQ